jgi:excisionase family DNA binding protein
MKLLTAHEVGDMLGVPVSWVYAESRAGRLPHICLGRYRRYEGAAIEAWMEGLRHGPTPYRKQAPGSHPEGSAGD